MCILRIIKICTIIRELNKGTDIGLSYFVQLLLCRLLDEFDSIKRWQVCGLTN